MANRKKPAPAYEPLPAVREHFRREIEQLLAEVPPEQWQDNDIRGVLYEFVPWHQMSSITVQTEDDDPRDIGGWKYYFSAESDGSLIREEHEAWLGEKSNKRLVYHKLLIEAAEALLSIDFSRYGDPDRTVFDEFCLEKTFYLQVYDVDETFRFNYCEYALARRLEPAR